MFNRDRSEDAKLEKVIDSALLNLEDPSQSAEDYNNLLNKLEKLYEIKAKNKPTPISRDTLAMVAGNLLGIVLIVGHERAHVVTSKALSFVMKAK